MWARPARNSSSRTMTRAAAVREEPGGQQRHGDQGDHGRGERGSGDRDREPQRRDQHRALHPPAQRHGQSFRVLHRASLSPRSPGSAGRVPERAARPDRHDPGSRPPSRRRPAAAVVRPSRRCRGRPDDDRRRDPEALRTQAGPDRRRARAARGVRRAGPPADPGWPPGTASRSSMLRAPSMPAIAARSSVCLVNLDPTTPIRLVRGDRIAQLVVQRHERASFVEVDALPGSVRGTGGYGSTGGFRDQTEAPHDTEES